MDTELLEEDQLIHLTPTLLHQMADLTASTEEKLTAMVIEDPMDAMVKETVSQTDTELRKKTLWRPWRRTFPVEEFQEKITPFFPLSLIPDLTAQRRTSPGTTPIPLLKQDAKCSTFVSCVRVVPFSKILSCVPMEPFSTSNILCVTGGSTLTAVLPRVSTI